MVTNYVLQVIDELLRFQEATCLFRAVTEQMLNTNSAFGHIVRGITFQELLQGLHSAATTVLGKFDETNDDAKLVIDSLGQLDACRE